MSVLTTEQVAMYRRIYDLDKLLDDPEHTGIEWGDASTVNVILDSHEQLRSDLAAARKEAVRWLAERDQLAADLASMTKEGDGLLRFAGAALTEVRIREIGDWDGADVQDALEACGLIVEKQRDVPCGESCNCLEFYGTGEVATCYPITELGKAAVAAWRAFEYQSRAASRPPELSRPAGPNTKES